MPQKPFAFAANSTDPGVTCLNRPGFARAGVVVFGTFPMMSGSGRMVELAPRNSQARNLIGVQPIAIGVVALVLVLFGIGSIALWRAFTGNAPETDRMVAARQLQARTAQVNLHRLQSRHAAARTHGRQHALPVPSACTAKAYIVGRSTSDG